MPLSTGSPGAHQGGRPAGDREGRPDPVCAGVALLLHRRVRDGQLGRERSLLPGAGARGRPARLMDARGLRNGFQDVHRRHAVVPQRPGLRLGATLSLTFYIVDVFAEERYAGNQLAVVRGGAGLPDEMLQKIALEMNYSETTFVLSEEESEGGYDVRIFTPGDEVPFAGHPTLGTAYVIRHEISAGPVESITLNLKAGEIPVSFGEVLWMRQLPPTFGEVLDHGSVDRTLNLATADLDDHYPVQEVSTGLPALIVPLRDLEALRRCKVYWERYTEVAASGKNLYVFCA